MHMYARYPDAREYFFRFGMDAFLLRDIIYASTSMINTEYEYNQVGQLHFL